jgi:hypothetical protein
MAQKGSFDLFSGSFEIDMKTSDILPFVRHALQFVGGLLVAKGWVDADTANELVTSGTALVGAALSIVALVWYRAEKK